MIDPFTLMRVDGVIRLTRSQTPDLYCAVQAGRCECVRVFRIECEAHYVVGMSFEDSETCVANSQPTEPFKTSTETDFQWEVAHTFPFLVPIP